MLSPKIIDFSSIYCVGSRNKKYDARVLKSARDAVLGKQGFAFLAVNPLHIEPYFKDPTAISYNRHLQAALDINKYKTYLGALKDFLSDDLRRPPSIVFYQRKDKHRTLTWLNNLPPKNIIITVEAQPGDAIPEIPFYSKFLSRWRIFSESLLSLGISELVIGGELAYEVGEGKTKEQCGEVHRVYDSLNAFLGFSNFLKASSQNSPFKLTIYKGLTFPNISVQRFDSKP